jgi:hypothetical protein
MHIEVTDCQRNIPTLERVPQAKNAHDSKNGQADGVAQ